MNQHRPQELAPRVALPGTDPDLGRLDHGILAGHTDRVIERILFRHNQGCQDLLGAGDLTRFVGIFLVERPAGAGVDEDRRDSADQRGIRRPKGSCGIRRNHHRLARSGSAPCLRLPVLFQCASGKKHKHQH